VCLLEACQQPLACALDLQPLPHPLAPPLTLQEKAWNAYYAHLLLRLCGAAKSHKMTLQVEMPFCLPACPVQNFVCACEAEHGQLSAYTAATDFTAPTHSFAVAVLFLGSAERACWHGGAAADQPGPPHGHCARGRGAATQDAQGGLAVQAARAVGRKARH
jgi:hypothetical protein